MLFLSNFCLFFFPSPSSRNIETEVIQIFRFGQVTRMGWWMYHIDRSTVPLERREQMNLFQTGGGDHEVLSLFLLSTRVGRSGFNLVATERTLPSPPYSGRSPPESTELHWTPPDSGQFQMAQEHPQILSTMGVHSIFHPEIGRSPPETSTGVQ